LGRAAYCNSFDVVIGVHSPSLCLIERLHPLAGKTHGIRAVVLETNFTAADTLA
jgi:hypothetical protein